MPFPATMAPFLPPARCRASSAAPSSCGGAAPVRVCLLALVGPPGPHRRRHPTVLCRFPPPLLHQPSLPILPTLPQLALYVRRGVHLPGGVWSRRASSQGAGGQTGGLRRPGQLQGPPRVGQERCSAVAPSDPPKRVLHALKAPSVPLPVLIDKQSLHVPAVGRLVVVGGYGMG